MVLWVVWGLMTALGRGRGVASAYDKSQRVFTALGGPIMIALIVAAPWEYANFARPIPRDEPLAWVGLALFAAGDILQATAMRALHGPYYSTLGEVADTRTKTRRNDRPAPSANLAIHNYEVLRGALIIWGCCR